MKYGNPKLAAKGVSRVAIAEKRIPPEKTHFPPYFSAAIPPGT
jgi:hypothetical protein